MYRIVVGSVLVISLIAGGGALAVEVAASPASQGTQAAPTDKSAGTTRTVRHSGKSHARKKVAHVRGQNAELHAADPFGSASGPDLPVASPPRQSAPSETPWTGFHVGVEGGRSGR